MKAIDELRDEIRILRDNNIDTDELVRIADAIERELEEGYVELPTDVNGEHIHIGDKLMGKYLEGNPVVECTRLTLTNGWMVGHGRQDGTADLFAHYKVFVCRVIATHGTQFVNRFHLRPPTPPDTRRCTGSRSSRRRTTGSRCRPPRT